MNTRSQKITIWDNVLPQVVTSSTDATPIVITKAAHGYATGDLIMIQGHATNIAANGIFKIVVLSSSTFSLYDQFTGLPVAGTGGGAGSGGVMIKMSTNQTPYTEEFQVQSMQLFTSGSATLTVKVAVSQGRPQSVSQGPGSDIPYFGATDTKDNPYTFVALVPSDEQGTPIDGDTGVVVSGTDFQKNYNISGLHRYLMPLLTSWSAGRITLVLNLSNNQ